MRILKAIYTAYCFLIFLVLFLILQPLFIIPILFKKQFKLVGLANRLWAQWWSLLVIMPYTIEQRTKLDKRKQYIFCPNHFSYLDIYSMSLNPHDSIFVGKSDMESVPLFGFMYRNLHITVDRTKLRSRSQSIQDSLKAIDDGKSLMIFPEGGIISKNIPEMATFKDGAFRIAIEKQIEIVPVTIPYNWIVLHPDKLLMGWRSTKLIFHEPIATTGLSLENVSALKKKTFSIIEEELQRQLNHEN